MSEYKINTEDLEIAKKLFGDRQNQRHLLQEKRPGQFSASRLYKYVLGHEDRELSLALGTDLSLRRVYKSLLQQQAYFHIPQALAASTDEFPQRHADGCVIRLQASRAESTQVYLIIEIADKRRDMPKNLQAFAGDDGFETVHLPEARNGVIQTIIDKNSALAKLLADPKTEIFLR